MDQASLGELSDVPELMPARMLNAFTYCERLFYLEWVNREWEDSADTAFGDFLHRRVDRKADALPLPADITSMGTVMSVRLESPRLGLVAILDKAETADGAVVPVDVKKGKPARDGKPWPSDRIQMLVQAALLADNGYPVDHAVLYYAETHQRVGIPVDTAAFAEVGTVAAQAREVAAAPRPPLPLVGSAKCTRCSLLGLCLPDETNALLARRGGRRKTITPRDPDNEPMYVTEPGASVGVRGGRVRVTKGEELLVEARLLDVSQLCLFGNVNVSAHALEALWDSGTPVLWFSRGGWLRGWAQGSMSKYVELRRRQTAFHAQGGFDVARAMVSGKIKNSRTLLRRNGRSDASEKIDQLASLAKLAHTVESAQSLLGVEGTAARIYFSEFTSMLGYSDAAREFASQFDANGRKRRPAPDPVNALLGFTYSLLTKDLVATCIGVGLDPYLGVYHRSRYGRPALALDLMEEFRPLIADSVVVNAINNGEITPSDFAAKGNAAWLTPDGRKKVVRAYERRMGTIITHPLFGYKASYRRVLEVQARVLAGVFVGELDAYIPMTTR